MDISRRKASKQEVRNCTSQNWWHNYIVQCWSTQLKCWRVNHDKS